MKKIKLTLFTFIIALATLFSTPLKSDAHVAVSFQFFYDNLAPYGAWVTYPGYGYVWSPAVAVGFRPYVSGGHWVYTNEGWLWVSDFDWGWAPFHYGSWINDPAYGWLWVPGYDWSPAWVTWGDYNGYYGWAPVTPGFSISVGHYPPINYWCFIEPRYITYGDWGNHYYVANDNRIIINNTTIINNERRINVINNTGSYGGTRYFAGPPRQSVERVTNTSIRPVSLRESGQPGRAEISGSTVNMFRPGVQSQTRNIAKPSSVASLDRIRQAKATQSPVNPRTSASQMQRMSPISPSLAAGRNNNVQERQMPSRSVSPQVTPQRQMPNHQNIPSQRQTAPQRSSAPMQRQAVPERPSSSAQRQAAPERSMPHSATPAQRQVAPERQMPQRTSPSTPQQRMPERQMQQRPQPRQMQPAQRAPMQRPSMAQPQQRQEAPAGREEGRPR